MFKSNLKIALFLFCNSVLSQNMNIQNNVFVIKKPEFIEVSIKDTLTLSKKQTPSITTQQKISKYTSNICFEKEHHSIWYLLESKNCGTLSFTLMPKNINDDYDFMIFQADTGNIEKLLSEGKLTLIRSNISRADKSMKGITGLNLNSKYNYTQKGINPSFSKSINVKTGSKLLIVFDNVYDNGKGFNCYFNLTEPGQYKAKTIDAVSKKPIKCDNQFCNKKGKILRAEYALSSEIKYKFKAENFNDNIDYDLNKEFEFVRIEKKGFFSDFITKSFMICENNNYIVEMQPLVKNDYYQLKEIYFNEDLTLNLKKSEIALNTYKEFLRKNPAYKFQLICYDNFNSLESKACLMGLQKFFNNIDGRAIINNEYKDTIINKSNCVLIKLLKSP